MFYTIYVPCLFSFFVSSLLLIERMAPPPAYFAIPLLVFLWAVLHVFCNCRSPRFTSPRLVLLSAVSVVLNTTLAIDIGGFVFGLRWDIVAYC